VLSAFPSCHKGGETTLRARREIILSAGAVGTPQILQLSGVGDGASLQKLGLDVVQNQPAVGQNMQDHFGINYFFKANQPTLNDVFGSWRGRLAAGLRYVLTRRGPLSLSVNQYGGLVRTRPDQQRADCQLYMNPLSYYSFHDGRRRLMRPDQFSRLHHRLQQLSPGKLWQRHHNQPRCRGSSAHSWQLS
jgi:choline dehydrogenase